MEELMYLEEQEILHQLAHHKETMEDNIHFLEVMEEAEVEEQVPQDHLIQVILEDQVVMVQITQLMEHQQQELEVELEQELKVALEEVVDLVVVEMVGLKRLEEVEVLTQVVAEVEDLMKLELEEQVDLVLLL
jgi:hypothetical protein